MNCESNACKSREKEANKWANSLIVKLLLACGVIGLVLYKLS